MECNNKILIISPNLEPGYCGVGDYVFVLKSFFEEEGHNCSLLALSDKYCDKIISQPNTLRIPFSTKDHNKIILAKEFIILFKPDIVYFNLVSYGYNKKGLPFYLLNFLPEISRKYKTVLIAHELWAGNFNVENYKNKFWGKVQCILFISLFRRLYKTEIIVTTGIAQNILKKYKLSSRLVSVFSNIPFEQVEEKVNPNSCVKLLFFGSSLFEINFDLFIQFLQKLSTVYGKCVQIDIVGRNNSTLVNWDKIAINFASGNLHIVKHGFLTAKKISHLMQEATIGITTYMPFFWGKSGAIAAMLAHGLPIVSIADEITIDKFIDNFQSNSRIWTLTQVLLEDQFKELKYKKIDFKYNLNIFNQLIASTYKA